MKLLYKCEYCKFTGIEEEVQKHEQDCFNNYNLKSCFTCKHRNKKLSNSIQIKCDCGVEIKKDSYIKFCNMHEREEEKQNNRCSILDSLFGGIL